MSREAAVRAERDARIAEMIRERKLTLREIGAVWGLSVERVRQIGCAAGVERGPVGFSHLSAETRARNAAKAAEALRGRIYNAALPVAVALVREGLTYGEAAEKLGLTRNQVAGACHRAGLKAPLDGEKAARVSRRQSQLKKDLWAECKRLEAMSK